ncbi:MAG TPA: Rpn family recombination-promoting nuclease/putative transposase [Candidatus Dorea faecipullorum]|nr:Rpn family recombination-promoting nuclease/putative transposase [Candidatus Dorea faecipullorum]
MSDIFMRNVLKKRECTEYILRIIMDREDLEVKEQILQKDYKNLQGRSAILDSVVCDMEEKRYNVEIQQENEGASVKRARYHSSLLDVNELKEGQTFEELPESYVIFIARNDVLGYGLPIYHITKKVEEVREDFRDGAHIIYVNAKIKDKETALGRLMYDLQCRTADEMFSEILAERVRELKETPEGVDSMCREMDEIYNEGIERGLEKGKMEMKQETVLSMANLGMPVEQIAAVVKESIGMVQKWISEGKTAV